MVGVEPTETGRFLMDEDLDDVRLFCASESENGNSEALLSTGDAGGDATLARPGYEKFIDEALLLGLPSSGSCGVAGLA